MMMKHTQIFFLFFCSISNVVFYFSQHENGDGSCKKGDFVFVCEHTIELVSKASLPCHQKHKRHLTGDPHSSIVSDDFHITLYKILDVKKKKRN